LKQNEEVKSETLQTTDPALQTSTDGSTVNTIKEQLQQTQTDKDAVKSNLQSPNTQLRTTPDGSSTSQPTQTTKIDPKPTEQVKHTANPIENEQKKMVQSILPPTTNTSPNSTTTGPITG
jgi:hypothetical protein